MDAINEAVKNPFEQSQLTTKYEIKGLFDNKYELLISINKTGRSITAFPLTNNLKKI